MINSGENFRTFHISEGFQSPDSRTRISKYSTHKKTIRSSMIFSSEQKLRTKNLKMFTVDNAKVTIKDCKSEDGVVESALNYLMLREFGCSRSEAIGYASPNSVRRTNFIGNLPPELRQKCIQSKILGKYQRIQRFSSKDDFEKVLQALKNYEERHSVTAHDDDPLRYVHLTRQKTKLLQEIEVNEVFEAKPQEKPKKNLSKPLVPDVKGLQKAIQSSDFLPFHKHMDKYNQSTLKKKKKKTKHEPQQLSPNNSGKTIKSRDFIREQSMEELCLTNDSPIKLNTCRPSLRSKKKGENHFSANQSKKIQIFKDLDRENDQEIQNFNLHKLFGEEKKLIDLIRLQKYQIAQKKGEELQLSLQQSQQRKRILEKNASEARLKSYELKKAKISLAQERKKQLKSSKLMQK